MPERWHMSVVFVLKACIFHRGFLVSCYTLGFLGLFPILYSLFFSIQQIFLIHQNVTLSEIWRHVAITRLFRNRRQTQ